MNSYIYEEIAKAKRQECIEEARIERIVRSLPNARSGVIGRVVRPVQQIARSVARTVVSLGAKLQEKQRPIL
jgi:hypothetical protein